MKFKTLILSVTLLLLISNCADKKKDDSQNNAILLLALQGQKNPGLSGLYASLMARNGNNGAQNYSNGSVSPFSVISQSQNCPKSGKMTLTGDMTQSMNGTQFTAQFTGVKLAYDACSLTAPNVENSQGASSDMLLEGEIEQNGTMTTSIDPASTPSLLKTTGSSTMKLTSSSYKVNGYLYPKFEITFKTVGSKTTIEHADDMDKAVMTIEETVNISGTIGTEKVEASHSYKAQFKLK